jgi:uncharacterized protein (DUF58 family)
MKNLLIDGVQAPIRSLIELRLLAPLINLQKQRKVLNELSGSHTSSIRGRGGDFSEVRGYQPGDYNRSMDWRVTARTGDPHIKVYQEERERPVHILCDLRNNMFFGSKVRFKSLQAAQVSGILAWAALAHGDRVGGLILSEAEICDLKPKSHKKGVLHFLQKLQSHSTPPKQAGIESQTGLVDAIKHLRRTTKPGSAIFIISDFQAFDESCEQQLYQLNRHNDITAINIFDTLEAQLPPAGLYQVSNGQQRIALNSQGKKDRQNYQQAFQARQAYLAKYLLNLGIPLINMSTQDDPINALQKGLGIKGGLR